MNKNIKKTISYLTILLLIILIVPVKNIIANMQSPLPILKIEDTTLKDDISYKIKLMWEAPGVSLKPEPNTNIQDPSGAHQLGGYSIFRRNATKAESYVKLEDKGANETVHSFDEFTLQSGSLYMYKVNPYHLHTQINGSGTIPARIDGSELEVLYMTDIEVSAEGSDNNLIVRWQNPTLGGLDVFDNFRIYYDLASDPSVEMPSSSSSIDVSINDPNLKRLRDGRLEYTFSNSNLSLGKYYSVKVEPMIGSQVFRNGIKKVNVNGKQYDIAYAKPAREYRTNSAYMKPSLNLREQGLDELELYWASLATSTYTIKQVELLESDYEDFQDERVIITLKDEAARDKNNSIIERPNKNKYYRLKITYQEGGQLKTMYSEIAIYDPGHTDFNPYSPDIVYINDNGKRPINMTVKWKAFLRKAYSKEEEANVRPEYDNLFLDNDITYDIYITDDVNNFDDPNFDLFPIKTSAAANFQEEAFKLENGKNIPVYKDIFNNYHKKTDVGYELNEFEENKIYYVKIVAVRNKTGEYSKPAFASHYIFPLDDINNRPIMMSKPPLAVQKDENGIEVITDNSIMITWDTHWYEIYDDISKKWYPKVGVDLNNNLVFDRDANKLEDTHPERIIYLNSKDFSLTNIEQGKAAIISKLSSLGYTNGNNLSIRQQKLDSEKVQYEINVITYDEMIKKGGYDVHLNEIINSDYGWNTITPSGDINHPEFNIEGLDPNTPYVIFYRPFYKDANGKKTSYLPNFVVGTTLKKDIEMEIVPTVPVLELVSFTDMTCTVRWNYSEKLQYELSIGDSVINYPEGGLDYLWEDIKDKIEVKTEGDKKYAYFTFENLFPDSKYISWIRSYSMFDNKEVYSSWSNPLAIKTLDILPPLPPKGLGIASKESVDTYNLETSSNEKPTTPTSIIVEWLKDSDDKGLILDGGVKDDGSLGKWLESKKVDHSYMALFKELVGNKDYYIRGKTRLTVTRDSSGKVERYYNYIIEIADNNEFLDSTIISVPTINPNIIDGKDVRIKESDWSKEVMLKTNMTTDEYDGDKDPITYPLPIDDYEIIYDIKTEKLTYRFRSNKVDENGNRDNMVDQRFISNLINSKIYDYELNLTNYQNKKIKTREIEIPYSIFSAFNERKINFTIRAGSTKVTIPYGGFDTDQVKTLHDLGQGSSIIITLTNSPEKLPQLKSVNGTYQESYVSTPVNLKIQLKTKSKTINLNTLSKELLVNFKIDNRHSIIDKNISSYFNDGNTKGWNLEKSTYDNVSGNNTMKIKKIGNYALIGRGLPGIVSQDPNVESTLNVFTNINIQDLANYNPSQVLTTTQLNNIVINILNGKSTFTINTPLSQNDINDLKKAQIFSQGERARKQDGVKSLVRVYEIKTGESIKNYNQLALDKINNIEAPFKISFQKALKINLIDNVYDNPTDGLTFSELVYMLDLILQEADI